jgi:RNA polymerase sigma factor (sigma-70 family)
MDDRELVTRLLAGGAAGQLAADEFVRRYRMVVTSALRRIRAFSCEDREDLFQDAFFRLLADDARVLSLWRGGSLAGYVRRITMNLAIDEYRSQFPHERLPASERERVRRLVNYDDFFDDDLHELLDAAPSPQEVVYLDGLRVRVQTAIEALPENDREVIQLVDIQGLSYEAAAERLGILRNNLGVRLSRARERLRHIIVGHYPAILQYFEGWA